MWPVDAESLVARQRELATVDAPAWHPGPGSPGLGSPGPGSLVGACWACFPRGVTGPGHPGDPVWAAAVVMAGDEVVDEVGTDGRAGSAYVPGLLALRLGPLLEDTVRALTAVPEVVLVDGTGRDHPRRAGLALHLGAELGLPTVGVTHRPLLAEGDWPADRRGATSPLRVDGEVVACWLRTRAGVRPLVVHPGWRTDLATATDLVMGTTTRFRTPEPLRRARHLARQARQGHRDG